MHSAGNLDDYFEPIKGVHENTDGYKWATIRVSLVCNHTRNFQPVVQ